MIWCHAKYPHNFKNFRSELFSAIYSSEARYARLCAYHPGIVKSSRWTRDRITGYPTNFPPRVFRVEYIIQVLYYHFEVVSFEHSCMTDLISLRHMVGELSKLYVVIFLIIFLRKSTKKVFFYI